VTRSFARAALSFLFVLSIVALVFASISPSDAATTRVHSSSRHTVVALSYDGMNDAAVAEMARQGAWYTGLIRHHDEEVAAQKAAEEKARKARESAARSTTSRSTGTTTATSSHDDSVYGDDDFYRLAQCETGSNWSHQTEFDGGLGILHANWIHDGGRQYAEWGSQATPSQHIREFGIHGWGCWRSLLG
jgi:hypothetical protein